jgi:GNAT superfamily N-acetyltransferase
MQGEVFSAAGEGEIEGIAVFTALPWETRIFGREMGILKYIVVDVDSPHKREIVEQLLGQIIDWAGARGMEFLLCKPFTDDILTIHALEKHGFLLMDTLLDYVYDFRISPLRDVPSPPLTEGAKIRSVQEGDLEGLLTIAQASFRDHFGRFHVDERICKRKAIQVYEEWIESSFKGYADWILVAEIDGRPAGYSVWKKPSPLEQSMGIPVGHYSIGATHPSYSGRGLFGALTFAGMKLFEGLTDYIEGPTHINNYQIQRAYAKLRWIICDARHSFHKWLTE